MADKKLPVEVVISAVDNVTYRVMAINEKIKRITAPIGKVKAAFSTLGDESGLGKLTKHLGEVGKTGKEFLSSLGEAALKIGATGLAAAGAIFELTHSFAEAGDNVAHMAAQLGLTTDSYQELSYAAKQANVSQEEFDAVMNKFSKGIGLAAAGTGDAFVGFNALGISVKDSTGHIRSMEDLLPTVADKLGAIQNQSLRNAIAAKIFGKEGAKLNGIFAEGSEGLSRLRKEARDVGAVMTPEQIKAAQEFDDGLKSITATVLSVRNAIGSALAPVLLNLGKTLQTYILSHQKEIQDFANAFADKLPGVLSQLANIFSLLASAISPVISAFQFLSSMFGEVNVVAGGLIAWFGGPAIMAFLKFAGAITKVVGPALRVAWVAFSILADVLVGIVSTLVAIVGWPVLIGAAFVAAAVLIYKYWEPIKDFLGSIGDKFASIFGTKASIDQTVTTNAAPQLGPMAGFGQTVDASKRSTENKSTSHVVVDFNNLPEGSRVEKKKDDGGNLDLFMGYAGVGAGA